MNSACRICSSNDLKTHLDFGSLYMTGHFPEPDEEVCKAPLALAKCQDCGLVQLRHSQPIGELYKDGYGYESHLNGSMRRHLTNSAKSFEILQKLVPGDVVIDIASNDGTLLSGYETPGLVYVGIDPLINSVSDFYPETSIRIESFFTKEDYFSRMKTQAKIITSFSVFYDLENPCSFMKDIEAVLTNDGIWVLEQSYLPTMISTLGFDTICHEHLLYLTLRDIQNLCEMSGLEIFDVAFNDVNGGSFRVFIQKRFGNRVISPFVSFVLDREVQLKAIANEGLIRFNEDIESFKQQITSLLSRLKNDGIPIVGLGASTKGNVLLQVCSINSDYLECIGEINRKKFGKVTPGTSIKIVSEEEALLQSSSSLAALILPWHFRDSIIGKLQNFHFNNLKFILPLPSYPTVISAQRK